ncbi:MAG TPA: hypothetical protein VFM41_13890 [Gaiella sp.]|nr:hypothetical protein [Gaiella sp.]
MTTLSNEPSRIAPGTRPWSERILVPEMWASLAIVTMWLAVLFDAVFGPGMVFTNDTPGSGTNSTIPSAVALALFAFLGTWVVAKHAFGRRGDKD